jgi:hypothetical protein
MRNIPVDGNQHVKAGFLSGSKKLSIVETAESSEAARLAIVVGELMSERLVNALVQQDTHQRAASKLSLASSRACRAISRVTVGKPSRNLSRL